MEKRWCWGVNSAKKACALFHLYSGIIAQTAHYKAPGICCGLGHGGGAWS